MTPANSSLLDPRPKSSVEVDKMHPFGTVVLPRKSSVAGRPVTGLTSRLSLHEANSFTVDDIYSRQKDQAHVR